MWSHVEVDSLNISSSDCLLLDWIAINIAEAAEIIPLFRPQQSTTNSQSTVISSTYDRTI